MSPFIVTTQRPSADPEAARLLSAARDGRLLRADSGRWYIDGEARPDRRVRQRLQSRRWLVFPRGWNRLDISPEGEAALALLQPVVTSVAVAALEDMRQEIDPQGMTDAAWRQVRDLPESGGSVGPLPDGSLISVERVTYNRLRDEADWNPPEGDDDYSSAHRHGAEVIAAFNAEQAS